MVNAKNIYKRFIKFTQQVEHRPWGSYEVLCESSNYKIKQIIVLPGQRLSYQRHTYRNEHWQIITGKALVIKNDTQFILSPDDCIDIPVNSWHRIQNCGTDLMTFIETQTGKYFGEDDIERAADDYGRLG